MRYRFYTADVFTDRIFGGNQLAVFPDASGLSGEQMQSVAREFNISETVFVFPPEVPSHTRRVRIFTPASELPFAGHPTVGTAYVLAEVGEIPLESEMTRIVLEEGVGPVPVAIRAQGGRPAFTQLTAARPPEFRPAPPPEAIAKVLSLEAADLLGGKDAPEAVSCGLPFLFVPLRSLDAVRRARLNREQWQAVLSSFWAPQIYPFSYETELGGSHVHARMFAPAAGIEEDPATGSAAAALAGYLGVRDATREGTLRWVVEQGFEIKRPSILEVEADKKGGEVTAIRVGGSSVLVSEGAMEIPD